MYIETAQENILYDFNFNFLTRRSVLILIHKKIICQQVYHWVEAMYSKNLDKFLDSCQRPEKVMKWW